MLVTGFTVDHLTCCGRELNPWVNCTTTARIDGSVFLQCPSCGRGLAVVFPPTRLFEDEPHSVPDPERRNRPGRRLRARPAG